MANRRMISKDVYHEDSFIEMSRDSRLLYTYLVLNADDDGLIDNPLSVARMADCEYKTCIEELEKANFIIKLSDKLFVVSHWLWQNQVQPSRRNDTKYQNEFKNLLIIDANKVYIKRSETCQHLVDNMPTQYRSEKNRLEKNRLEKSSSSIREESDTDTSDTDNDVSSSSQYSLKDLIKYYEDNVLGHKSSRHEQFAFMILYDQYGDKQLRDAISSAALNNAGGINYIKTVLQNGTNYSPEKWRAEHGQ